ncbi:MAG: hypothetical protein HUK15_01540, partial [Bacteroidales bacterium]|nr:hypothetical protein [Bacteroidales bacterium]
MNTLLSLLAAATISFSTSLCSCTTQTPKEENSITEDTESTETTVEQKDTKVKVV